MCMVAPAHGALQLRWWAVLLCAQEGRPQLHLLKPLQVQPSGPFDESRPPHPNPADCLFMEASLVAADRLYATKRQILEELGLGGWAGWIDIY